MLRLNSVIPHSTSANVVNIAVNPPKAIYSIDDFAHLETSSRGLEQVDSVIDLNDRDKDLITFIYLDNNRRDLMEVMPLAASQTEMVWLLRRLYGIGLNDSSPDVPLGSNDADTASVLLQMVANSYEAHGEEIELIEELLKTSSVENVCENFREALFLDCENRLEDILDDSMGSFRNYMEFDHVED